MHGIDVIEINKNFSHLGQISDKLREGLPDTYFNRFQSLQSALYAGPFFAALSFGAYLICAIYIEDDKKEVELYIKSILIISSFKFILMIFLLNSSTTKIYREKWRFTNTECK